MKGLDLRKFKKVETDGKSSTFKNDKGAEIKISHAGLSPLHLKQLNALPIYRSSPGEIPEPMPTGEPSPTPEATDIGPDESTQAPADMGVAPNGTPNALLPNDQTGQIAPTAETPPSQQQVTANDIPGVKQEKLGIEQQATTQQQQANYLGNAQANYRQGLQIAGAEWQNASTGMEEDIAHALKDVQNGHINPRQYLENMSVPSKIASAIGLFLGGISNGLIHQGNPAMDFLNRQIDRDIDAQKAGLNNKLNVYHAYLDKYKNAQVAEQMARATQYALYASNAKEITDKFQGAEAQAQKNMLIGGLFQKAQGAVQNANLLRATAPFDSPAGTGSEAQYQTALQAAQMINPEKHKDMISKYIPGVGTTAIPVDKEDLQELSIYRNLNELAKQGQALAETTGRTMWGSNANQEADDIRDQMQTQIGLLTGLRRINAFEAKKYSNMVRSPGAWNNGAAIQSFKDMRANIAGKTQSLGDKLQIKPFRK